MLRYLFVAAVAAATAATATWQTPVNLGANVNTADSEWYPFFTPDGWTMVFVSTRPGGAGAMDLYRSSRSGGGWLAPDNLGSNVNSGANETAPFITADGARLYFASECDGGFGTYDIWYAPLTNGVPGAKVHLPAPINTSYVDCCPVVTADGNTMYLGSELPSGYGGHDIYVSTWNGTAWSEPANLGADVNSAALDCPRWISADGNTLLFISMRAGGEGSVDLWYTIKSGGVWGTPQNMGATLNTGAIESGACFRCNNGALGGIIYYGSGRAGGYGGLDLWQSTDSAFISVEPSSVGRVKAAYVDE